MLRMIPSLRGNRLMVEPHHGSTSIPRLQLPLAVKESRQTGSVVPCHRTRSLALREAAVQRTGSKQTLGTKGRLQVHAWPTRAIICTHLLPMLGCKVAHAEGTHERQTMKFAASSKGGIKICPRCRRYRLCPQRHHQQSSNASSVV